MICASYITISSFESLLVMENGQNKLGHIFLLYLGDEWCLPKNFYFVLMLANQEELLEPNTKACSSKVLCSKSEEIETQSPRS
jgi:hypothetical protein